MSTLLVLHQIVSRLSKTDRATSFDDLAQSWDAPDCRRRLSLFKPLDRKESKEVLAYLQKSFVPPMYFEKLLEQFPTPEVAQRATNIWLGTVFREFDIQKHRFHTHNQDVSLVWSDILDMLHKSRPHIPYWSPSPSHFNTWVELSAYCTKADQGRQLVQSLNQLSPTQVGSQIDGWLDKVQSFVNTRSSSGPYQQSKNKSRDRFMFQTFVNKEAFFFDVFSPSQCARFKDLVDAAQSNDVEVIGVVINSARPLVDPVFARATQHVLTQEVNVEGKNKQSTKKM